ncbi:MAG: hypothetical protein CMP98_06945 [Gammaproteobacteria bacterium]|nr:hypothetical protein [Gammaproteobacteria bacterium]
MEARTFTFSQESLLELDTALSQWRASLFNKRLKMSLSGCWGVPVRFSPRQTQDYGVFVQGNSLVAVWCKTLRPDVESGSG